MRITAKRTALNIAMQSSMACIHKRFNEEAKEDEIEEATMLYNTIFEEVKYEA